MRDVEIEHAELGALLPEPRHHRRCVGIGQLLVEGVAGRESLLKRGHDLGLALGRFLVALKDHFAVGSDPAQ